MHAISTILRRMDERNTLVCPGIDPNIDRFPAEIRDVDCAPDEKVRMFLREYIDIASPDACSFKVQKAYFDAFPNGHALLHEAIAQAQAHGVPVIVDCKIGDIDETMKAYRRNLFDILGADGIVVNPYMGDDVMLPLAEDSNRIIVPLVKTSNSGGSVVQDIKTERGVLLWQEILEMVVNRWNAARNMAPVIASTQNVDLRAVRALVPDDMPIFFAGMGAQGGSAQSIRDLLDSYGRGVLVNSSRGLMYPQAQDGEHWKDAICRSVRAMRDELNGYRQ